MDRVALVEFFPKPGKKAELFELWQSKILPQTSQCGFSHVMIFDSFDSDDFVILADAREGSNSEMKILLKKQGIDKKILQLSTSMPNRYKLTLNWETNMTSTPHQGMTLGITEYYPNHNMKDKLLKEWEKTFLPLEKKLGLQNLQVLEDLEQNHIVMLSDCSKALANQAIQKLKKEKSDEKIMEYCSLAPRRRVLQKRWQSKEFRKAA